MIKNYICLVFLSLFFMQATTAQKLTSFAEDRVTFLKQLEGYITSSKRKVLEEAYKEFEKELSAGVFTEEEIPSIIATCNKMLSHKMAATPYFLTYIQSITKIKKNENGEQKFKDWHEVSLQILDEIQGRKLNAYRDFLKFSLDFYGKNTLRYSKSGVTWFTDSYDFKLAVQEGTPIISYQKLNLLATRGSDTIVIKETSGEYDIVKKSWNGAGGKVTWESTDLGDEVFCELEKYSIDVKKATYEVTDANLSYPQFFSGKKIIGTFKDKITAGNNKGNSYPRFESKDTVLQLDIGNGIQYVGGFRLHGSTVYGYGTKRDKATITIFDPNNVKRYYGASELFVIRKGENILAERVVSTVFFDKDSIHHPSVNVKLDIVDNRMELYRGKRGSDRNPFFFSFHQMNIDSDNIEWDITNDSIFVAKKNNNFAKANNVVTFESLKYFEEGDYRRFQNIASTNPISTIKQVADEEGSTFLSANNLARRLNSRFDVTSIQSLLYDLVAGGFVNYDSDRQIVEVKDKIYHYAKASQKSTDYDVMKVTSKLDDTHAVLDLKTKDLSAFGVSNLEFSTKQRVAAKPFEKTVDIKENRNIDFDGKLFAGYGIFEGKDLSFIYDDNQIEMDSVRYFDLFVPTDAIDEKTGQAIALSISSRIEHTAGVLLIDAPSNKSGIEDLPMFPSFNTKGPSYVYYDNNEIKGGAYSRDSFYFKLDPFNFNNLDGFTKEDVHFKGAMVSADIFPEFKETLVLQEEDESLGFVTETPQEGFPTYQHQGNFKGTANLSNNGLTGTGDIKYLGATFNSDSISFKPKQLTAFARLFEHDEIRSADGAAPKVVGHDVSINWLPYRDSMYVKSKEKVFEFFQESGYTLDGTVILTPSGVKGKGTFDWEKGSLNSKLLSFGAFAVQSDTANLKIKALGADDIAFDTRDVFASLDFENGRGRVVPNSEDLTTTMPYNKYQTSASELLWNMKEEVITLINDKSNRGGFLSIDTNQDSLYFEGEKASYDLKSNELKIGGVPLVQSCDAYIYPETGDIKINPGGAMETLTNAKIVADTSSKYHVINRATVTVNGKKDYRASGFYEYNIGLKKQEIEFADIIGTRVGKGKRSEKKTATRAYGEVTEEDHFFIDRKTEFRGKITLDATEKELEFEGFARLDAVNLPSRQWFSIRNKADKNDLVITYDTPKNYKGDPLKTGLFISKETARMYPSIMMPLYLRKDRPLVEATGIYKYNVARDEFVFGDSMKITSNTLSGNKVVFSNKDGGVEIEGKFNIGAGLNYINVDAAGRAITKYDPNSEIGTQPISYEMKVDLMAGVNIILPEQLMRMVVNDFKSSAYDAEDINYQTDNYYEKALAEFIPTSKEMAKASAELANGAVIIPKKHNKYSFFFSQLPMKWSEDYQSLVSSQAKLGLYSINGEIVDKMLECYVEFRMPSNQDDRLYIYIKSPSGNFYFFGFKQGILSTASNNMQYNEAVLNLKKKESQFKMDDGEFYEILPVNQGSANMFLNRVRTAF